MHLAFLRLALREKQLPIPAGLGPQRGEHPLPDVGFRVAEPEHALFHGAQRRHRAAPSGNQRHVVESRSVRGQARFRAEIIEIDRIPTVVLHGRVQCADFGLLGSRDIEVENAHGPGRGLDGLGQATASEREYGARAKGSEKRGACQQRGHTQQGEMGTGLRGSVRLEADPANSGGPLRHQSITPVGRKFRRRLLCGVGPRAP
jgi:hypothetical protein